MIDVALVGCGRWGRRLLAALVAHPEMRVCAVVDPSPAALAVATITAPGVALHASLRTVLEGELDAALVATPPALHAAHARALLEAGLDVFVEKPLATSAADALALCTAAERSGRIAMVGHILRFHPAVNDFVAAVRSGQIGTPREVIVRRHTQSGSPDPIWALGPHDLATLHGIDPSPPLDIEATATEAGVALELTLTSGLRAHLDLSTTAAAPRRTTVVRGTEGLLSLDELDAQQRGDGRGADPLRRELDHFVACVRERRQPLTSFVGAHWVVAALEQASASLTRPEPQLATR